MKNLINESLYVFLRLFGSTISPVLLGWSTWKENSRLILDNVRLPVIWRNMKRYRRFVVYNTPATLLNNLSSQIPSFLLSFFFSTTIVGYYAFGNQLLRMPMSLVGGSIGQAFYSYASTAKQEGNFAEFVEKNFRQLIEYSFFFMLILSIIGKPLCIVFFGGEWAEAGGYIQILSIWMVFWFISSPMSQLYSVLQKNELFLGLNLVILVTRIASIWLGGVLESPRLALLFFSISGAVVYGFLGAFIIFFSGVPWRRIVRIILENLSISILAGGILFSFKLIHVVSWAQLIMTVFFIGIYFAYRFKDDEIVNRFLAKRMSIH